MASLTTERNAVCVRGACKSYGRGKHVAVILKNLSMTVPRGCIYGLLGASGCGKTTLLSSIVGRKTLDQGDVTVLGERGTDVPLHKIGYMPQEIGLMEDLTIEETVKYFSWIYGIPNDNFDEKLTFYLKLLELPMDRTLISKLSGGQQRRVSLMVSLFHNPELLILDEPTVGIDPMLRERVWDHLVQETKKHGRTVIITTHYIEEARKADLIGIMRGGRLLAENSPGRLLSAHQTNSLEDVFLKLAIQQETENKTLNNGLFTPAIEDVNNFGYCVTRTRGYEESCFSSRREPNVDIIQLCKEEKWERKRRKRAKVGRWKALLLKNGVRFFRNPEHLIFNLVFPILQVTIFFLTVGNDPKNLPIAIVNKEFLRSNTSANCSNYIPVGCNDPNMGCRYIDLLSKSKYFKIIYKDDLEEALEGVRRGKFWGTIMIPENFTEALINRRDEGRDADEFFLETGNLDVYLDMSNQQIGLIIRNQLITEFTTFKSNIMQDCGMNEKIGQLPLRFEDPIYGDKNSTFQEFCAPPSIITIVFFMAVIMTSTIMTTERYEGLWDRTLVTGLTAWELLLGHIMLQIILVFLQSVEALFIALVVFGFPCRGSIILSLLLTCLQGTAGMCCGFLISIFSRSISDSHHFSCGCFYPAVLLGGFIWPLQGAHWLIRKVCFLMPTTAANVALRHILLRGWGIYKSTVLIGFGSTLAWTSLFIFLCYIGLRMKK